MNKFNALVGFFIAVLMASCNQESITPTENLTTTALQVALPTSAAVATLNTLFPNTGNNTWYQAGVDLLATEVKFGSTNAFAYFDIDGTFITSKIETASARGGGGKKHCNGDTLALSNIPASVVAEIATKYAGYTIKKACVDTVAGVVQYRIKISNATSKITLLYDVSWAFVSATTHGNHGNSGDITITLAEVPAAAITYVSTNYTAYTINAAEKDTTGGITIYELYISSGTTKVKLIFDATGVFVKATTQSNSGSSHTQVTITLAEVPAAAIAYVSTNYVGYTITKAEKSTSSAGVITYELYLSNGTTNITLVFDANGVFVKVKSKIKKSKKH